MGATSCPGLASKWILERVVVPKSHERAREFREGARHGDVVLRRTLNCCVRTVG